MLIDIKCEAETCGEISEVNRPLAMWPATPECPKCGNRTDQIHLPKRSSKAEPVIVYRMPDGTFRFPGAPNSVMTRKYDAEGATRLELRGWEQVRPFEKHMNQVERDKIHRRMERQAAWSAQGIKERRSELYRRMASMSDGAKAFGRALVRLNDSKPTPKAYDPDFHVEAYSNTRSNREEARDDRGRKFKD